jgi:predicted O-methyltransferase YrrM
MQLPWRDLAPGDGPPIPTSITERETARLRELATGRRVLEVGSAYGYSTVVLALVAPHVTAVDPHQWLTSRPALEANLAVYGIAGRVDVLADASGAILPALADHGERFDLVFIDGDHAEAAVIHDVTWARKLLAPGGVLACHDYDEVTCPGVRTALDRLMGGPGELTDTLAVYEGLA